MDEFGSCPAGPGRSSRRIIHNIVELVIDFYDDSCYKVIRNRIGYPEVTKILFLKWATRKISPHELKNLGVKTVYLVISHPIEEA